MSDDEGGWHVVTTKAAVPSQSHHHALPSHEDNSELLVKWKEEQSRLKAMLVEADDHDWSVRDGGQPLRYIGGVDVSFIKGNEVDACACLVVLEYPSLQVVYEDFEMVQLTQPYIAGFLAFREVHFIVNLVDKLRTRHAHMLPQVIFVDGNGILHHRAFGQASHLGVLIDIPTIGIGKNLLCVDGMTNERMAPAFESKLRKQGDMVELRGDSGRIWGAAVRCAEAAVNPVFVSIGHRVSLETAVQLTIGVSRFRIPEPVRQADQRSREFLRKHASHLKPRS